MTACVHINPFQGKMCHCGCDNGAYLPWGDSGQMQSPLQWKSLLKAIRLWIKAVSLRNVSSLPLSEHTYPGFQVRQIMIPFLNLFLPWTGASVSLQEKVCFSLCPIKTPNLPSYSKGSRTKKKICRGRLYTPDLSYFSLQKTIFEYYVIEPPCLMTLLMHCYQVVPSVFGQMCSLVCLLSINYLYLKFNGSYIYLDICT